MRNTTMISRRALAGRGSHYFNHQEVLSDE